MSREYQGRLESAKSPRSGESRTSPAFFMPFCQGLFAASCCNCVVLKIHYFNVVFLQDVAFFRYLGVISYKIVGIL